MKSYALAILICLVWAINAAPGNRDFESTEIHNANFNESYEFGNDDDSERFIEQRRIRHERGSGQVEHWSVVVDDNTHRLPEGAECQCGRMDRCSALCIDGLTCQKTNDYDERHHQMMSKCLQPPITTQVPRL